MTVRQLLSNLDSREISEWIIYSNLPYWQQRLATKEHGRAPRSKEIIKVLFGKALKTPGGVTYGSKDN